MKTIFFLASVVVVLSLSACTQKPVAGRSWTNSLGVKFVPAGTDGVLFSVWDVRVKDFKAFVDATGYDATAGMLSVGSGRYLWDQRGDTWKSPGFAQTDDSPVVGVSWNDAHAFCDWLTKKEQAEGKLGPNQSYRLPTDTEWSKAVGLNESSEGTPEDKSKRIKDVYPWGTQWPPPPGAGNYAGSEANDGKRPNSCPTIDGYRDGYARTSPVGTFTANQYGLYDMGGNVSQWCEDRYDTEHDWRVLRGAGWDGIGPGSMLSSCRDFIRPDDRYDSAGFRCVVVVDAAATQAAAAPPAAQPMRGANAREAYETSGMPPPIPQSTGVTNEPVAGQPWTNSLGMKFVPAGTDGVLFSVWDARVKDFKAFVDATGYYDATGGMYSVGNDGWKQRGDTWKSPGFVQTDDSPVVGVNWYDAHAFCDWLTKQEHFEGKLASNQTYRLPTDAEWSMAVGLNESSEGLPRDKHEKIRDIYPWGTQWPPPPRAGNYAGSETKDAKWPSNWATIDDYSDGYARTSPVGSFAANSYGLYDMGGNVWQWCEDELGPADGWGVLRGASWYSNGPDVLLSSFRQVSTPVSRYDYNGFRCVVVVPPPPGSSTPGQITAPATPEAQSAFAPTLQLTEEQPHVVEQIPHGLKGDHGNPSLRINPNEVLITTESFTPPIAITIVAKTDSTNLRISYTANQVIFNWEEDNSQLRVDGGPGDGRHQMNKGLIPINKYVTIRWIVTNTGESIYVDDDLRFQNSADYSQIDNPISIFGSDGSILDVMSLTIRRLSASAAFTETPAVEKALGK